MSARIAAAAVMFLSAGPLAAQTPTAAYIVTRLGVDTVAIERYTRTPSKLEGDVVVRNPRVQTFHYVADLGARGQLKNFHLTVLRAGTEPSALPRFEVVDTFRDSLAVLEVPRTRARAAPLSVQ